MLYEIHRYPADLIDVVRLGRGGRVLIRPVLPQDEDLTSAFFGRLPARARYDRFLAPVRDLSPELVKRFTNIDYASHLALVAETFTGGHETVVAEARYARTVGDASVAEFAVSVAEDWQGRGLASLLLAKLLCRATAAGIARVVGETLASNEKMLHLARKAGFAATPSAEVHGVILLEKRLETGLPGADCAEMAGGESLSA
ncbi:MAG TPA: GNAT family N-acetyltransferase [Hyphomicrobiaceae bacterium]|jgi:acetyltransferase|nr:GNAT family N-acetyltransferase [Hyphomicrobiaceae bacterium]